MIEALFNITLARGPRPLIAGGLVVVAGIVLVGSVRKVLQ